MTLPKQLTEPSGLRVQSRRPGRAVFGFLAVGVSGLVVNSLALAVAVSVFHAHYLPGLIAATACSTMWNFFLVERLVFTDGPMDARSMTMRFVQFAAVNVVALAGRGPVVVGLVEGFHLHYLVANAASLGALFAVRYLLADKIIWRAPAASAPAAAID
jgi:putative flippase GtrA